MEISKKHILITGAADRIGNFLVNDLLKQYPGVKVSAHYHKSKPNPIHDPHVKFFSADLSIKVECETLFKNAVGSFGMVDILIHGASVFEKEKLENISEESLEKNFALHLKSAVWLAQGLVKNLKGKEGCIIHLLDVFSSKPLTDHLSYSTSKAALGMLTKSLAKDCAPNLRVNSLSPGTILPQEGMTEEEKQRAIKKNLFQYWPGPSAIAGGVHFLLENEYITGFNLMVDGGRCLN